MDHSELVLIDLSSIAHPIWHASVNEPDRDAVKNGIVARVRGLASDKAHVAICCDTPPYFRQKLDATYKANREERNEPLIHQIRTAKETLVLDGFPAWGVQGFEADDIIASAVKQGLAADVNVLIVSSDKDLLQLCGPRVRQMSATNGAVLDVEGVIAKFGVKPSQMCDYLCLVGDSSDNVKGAKGIGTKKAAEILALFETLTDTYAALNDGTARLAPSIVTALREFEPMLPLTRSLIALRDDVPLPFAEVLNERVARPLQRSAAFAGRDEGEDEMDQEETSVDLEVTPAPQEPVVPTTTPVTTVEPKAVEGPGPVTVVPTTAMATRKSDAILVPTTVVWERELDPRSQRDARNVALDMFNSQMFRAYGTPEGVLSTIMLGRELGLPAMAALRSIHIIEGKQALSASLMVALVMKSGLAEYFEPVSFSDTEATYETKRKLARNPVRLTHTIEQARTAGLVKDKSGWLKNPTDMLVARAQARLARMVYPDLLAGLYSPEELEDIRAEKTEVA